MNEELDEILGEVRIDHRRLPPPAHVGAHLALAARSPAKRGTRIWFASIAAAALIGVVLWQRRPVPVNPLVKKVEIAKVSPSVIPKAAPPAQIEKRVVENRRATIRPVRLREFVTEFIPLPGAEALPMPLETNILRVSVPKGELRQYGFDVPPPRAAELVRADLVVGDDGFARAVRFIQ